MEFEVLGPVAAVDGARRVRLGPTREGTLLALLLAAANHVVSTDRMVEALWSGSEPPGAHETVPKHVHRLRRLLDPDRPAGIASRIETRPPGYLLTVGRGELDAWRFEDRLAAAHRLLSARATKEARSAIVEALAEWNGPAYADFSSIPFSRAESGRLDELRSGAIETRIECDLSLGNDAGLLGEIDGLVTADPLRENLVALLMLALYRGGRQADALRAYERLRTMLADQLGLVPGARLRELQHAILVQSPDLDRVPTPDTEVVVPSAESVPEARRVSAVAAVASTRMATFLFSDIVQSTALWLHHADDMALALERHDRILQAAFEAGGGTVFAHGGDGLAVHFGSVASALSAAVNAQIDLQQQDWGAIGTLAVRMALHCGEAHARDGNFFGPPLNMASRLMDAAHGGQIIVSDVLGELARDVLPADLALHDLGLWQFDGLDRPERVFDVRHPALGVAPEGLAAGRPMMKSMPVTEGSFAGRGLDMDLLREALEAARLVTVTGAGGAGKTRLAVEAALVLGQGFADGAVFVDLARVSDGSGVGPRLAEAIGARYPNSAGVDWIAPAIGDAALLVVLDNCEHVLDAAAAHAEALLAASPALRIVATSRERLRLPAERVLRLQPLESGPLGLPGPAVDLLIERAQSAGATVDAQDPYLQQIARAVDGLPLAIELLAPRLVYLQPEDLAEQLAKDGAMAASGRWSRHGRNSTLAATFAWSYDLLGEQERRYLETMSVCPGGVSLEGAASLAAVAGLEPADGRALVSALIERSLVNVDRSGAESRFRMLQPVREYARLRLIERGWLQRVSDEFCEQLAAFLERVVPNLHGPDEARWASRIDAEFDNIRSAMTWCVGEGRADLGLRLVTPLIDHELARGRVEVAEWALAATGIPGAEDHSLYPCALGIAAHAEMEAARFGESARLTDAAVEAAHRIGIEPPWNACAVRVMLAAAGQLDSDLKTEMQRLRAIADASGDLMGRAVTLFERATIFSFGPHPEMATETAQRLVALGRESECATITAMGLLSVGWCVAKERPDEAFAAWREADRLAASVGSRTVASQAARSLVQYEGGDGDSPSALARLIPVLQRFRQDNDLAQQMVTVMAMLPSFVALGELEMTACLCAALQTTGWSSSTPLRAVEEIVASRLDATALASAVRSGSAMSSADLVRLALASADRLTASVRV